MVIRNSRFSSRASSILEAYKPNTYNHSLEYRVVKRSMHWLFPLTFLSYIKTFSCYVEKNISCNVYVVCKTIDYSYFGLFMF